MTVALRLRVQAGIEFVGSPLLSAQALAGAFINIPEVVLGETASLELIGGGGNGTTAGGNGTTGGNGTAAACAVSAFAEVNINAGVFVDIGADIGLVELVDFNPTLATTFFRAAVTTCLDGLLGGGGGAATSAPALPPYVNATATATATAGGTPATTAMACATDLVTETTTTVITVALTSCALPVVNCPANMTQVVVAERTETITSSSCPGGAANATATATAPGNADIITTVIATAPTTTTCTGTAPALATGAVGGSGGGGVVGGGPVTLTKLATTIASELSVDPAVTPPSEPTVTAVARGGEVAAVNMTAAAEGPSRRTAFLRYL